MSEKYIPTCARSEVTIAVTSVSLLGAFFITKTRLYNFEPHFYIVKLGLTGVYIIFLITA